MSKTRSRTPKKTSSTLVPLSQDRRDTEFGSDQSKLERFLPLGGIRATSRGLHDSARRGKCLRLFSPLQLLPAFLLCLNFSPNLWSARSSALTELQQAAKLIERGEYQEAEAQLQAEVKADPSSAVARRLLGLLYQRQNKFEQAEKALEEAARLSRREDPQTLLALCQVKFALKKSREALAVADEISRLAPRDPGAHLLLGRLLRENSVPDRAGRELELAGALAPSNPAITTELVAAYLDQGRSKDAESLFQPFLKSSGYEDLMQAGLRFGETGQFSPSARAFERALEMRPGSYDALFNLALAYYRQQDFPKASATLDRVSREAAEEHPDYHYLRGKIELALQHNEAAGEELLRALEREPDNESLCSDAGLLFFRFENFWKALEIYQACARHLPGSVPIQTGLGLALFRLGKYDSAADTFKKVLALRPDADAAREALAFLLYVSGNLPDARKLLEERLGAPDVDYYAGYLHALVLLRLEGRAGHAAALQSLDKALQVNPRFAPAYFQRGRIWAEAGERERALADLEKATELDPAFAQPYYLIAQIKYKLGKKDEADQARQRFAALHQEREEKEQKQQVENRLLQAVQ